MSEDSSLEKISKTLYTLSMEKKNRTAYKNSYNAAHYKSVLVNLRFEDYDKLKAHCDKANEPIVTFIKRAIARLMEVEE